VGWAADSDHHSWPGRYQAPEGTVVGTWVPHQDLLGLEWHQLILVAESWQT
jgi:hypothetical protein